MSGKIFKTSAGSIHFALLVIRVGFGIIFMFHGWPKITGGVETWTWLGGAMGNIGLGFAPAFWGFLAAIAEFVGGLFLILGLLTRPFAAMMLFTMIMATIMHVANNDPQSAILHTTKGIAVFTGFLFSGAGKYSIDNMLAR